MSLRQKIDNFFFDFNSLNEEAQEELDNGRSESDELQQTDEQVPADSTTQREAEQ